jgi:fatty acid desaturase
VKPSGSLVFVERSTYRHRRLTDAARVLPVIGALLWLLPLLWGLGSDAPKTTSSAMMYIFGVWLVLVVLSAGITRYLAEPPGKDETESG